jgi:hypothetical protein
VETQVVCRADARPFTSQRFVPTVLTLLSLAAFAGCSWYMQHHPVADRFTGAKAEYGIWTAVFAAVAGYATASAGYGWCFLRGMLRLSNHHRWPNVASWILLVIVAGGIVQAAMAFSAARTATATEHKLQSLTLPLIVLVSLLATPALAGFLALRAVALDDRSWTEDKVCQMRLLIRLRAECQRLLVVLSVFLTLLVIATGLRRRALLAIEVKTPEESVLLYGLVFATLLALFYLAASSGLDSRCEKFLKLHADLPDPDDPELSAAASRRKDLAAFIGVGGSWSTFATVAVVASPLLSALLGSATGK